MSRSQSASTFFSTGALDTILTKDAYDVDGTSKSTDIRDILQGLADDTIETIRSTPGIAEDVVSSVLAAKEGRLTKADALLRATQALGGRGGVLSKLSSRTQDTIFGALGVDAEKQGTIMSAVGDVVQATRTSDLRGANDIMDIVGRLTGGNSSVAKLFDLEAESAVLSGIVGEAIQYGLPDAVDDMMRSASSDRVRYNVANSNLAMAIYSSDLQTLSTVVNAMGAQTVRAKYPNFVHDFLMGYRLPLDTKENDYPGLLTKITGIFAQIDPQWDQGLVGSVWMPSVGPFIGASQDAVTLFSYTPDHRTAVTIAQNLDDVEINSWIKDNYPYYPG